MSGALFAGCLRERIAEPSAYVLPRRHAPKPAQAIVLERQFPSTWRFDSPLRTQLGRPLLEDPRESLRPFSHPVRLYTYRSAP